MKSCLTNDQIIHLLRKEGMQVTAPRVAICKYVLCQKNHATAEDVKHWLEDNFPTVSLATVYNTLNALVKVGLLHEIKMSNSDKIMYDNNSEKHYHFYNKETGEIHDVLKEKISISLHSLEDIEIEDIELIIRGTQKK